MLVDGRLLRFHDNGNKQLINSYTRFYVIYLIKDLIIEQLLNNLLPRAKGLKFIDNLDDDIRTDLLSSLLTTY